MLYSSRGGVVQIGQRHPYHGVDPAISTALVCSRADLQIRLPLHISLRQPRCPCKGAFMM
eukprot:8289645-Heterocapsa_arctica.AAC.1